jgi:hypothetical protein
LEVLPAEVTNKLSFILSSTKGIATLNNPYKQGKFNADEVLKIGID